MGGTSLLPALAMIAMATLATAAEDSGHAIFTKDKVPLGPHLVLQTAARSEVDCVSLCTSAPACHRAVFSQVTGTCQGHGWTADWCAVGLTSVWVKGEYIDCGVGLRVSTLTVVWVSTLTVVWVKGEYTDCGVGEG